MSRERFPGRFFTDRSVEGEVRRLEATSRIGLFVLICAGNINVLSIVVMSLNKRPDVEKPFLLMLVSGLVYMWTLHDTDKHITELLKKKK